MSDQTERVAKVKPLQDRVACWMEKCFGAEISADTAERNYRFLEEALELVQSKGCSKEDVLQLVDYVFGRDIGEPHQEVGGVMITLAALCLASGLDMHQAGEDELERIWTKIDAIREKQANKPIHSPLPQHVTPAKTYEDGVRDAIGIVLSITPRFGPDNLDAEHYLNALHNAIMEIDELLQEKYHE